MKKPYKPTIQAILVHNYWDPFNDPMSILAWCIRKIAKTKYNHVELLIHLNGSSYVIGSVYPKVRKISFDEWFKQLERDIIFLDIPSTRSPEEMIRIANEQVGKPYDLSSLLLFVPIYFLTGIWIGRKKDKAERRPYCYELLGMVAGWESPGDITPNEAINRLKSS